MIQDNEERRRRFVHIQTHLRKLDLSLLSSHKKLRAKIKAVKPNKQSKIRQFIDRAVQKKYGSYREFTIVHQRLVEQIATRTQLIDKHSTIETLSVLPVKEKHFVIVIAHTVL